MHNLLRVRRLRESEKGAHIVELALMLPIYFLMILVAFDLARIVVVYTGVTVAARKGARQGAIPDGREIGLTAGNRPEFAQLTTLFGGFPGQQQVPAMGGFLDENPILVYPPGRPDLYGAFYTGAESFEGEVRGSLHPSGGIYRTEVRAMTIANMSLVESLGKWAYPCKPGYAGCPNGQDMWVCFTTRGSNSYANGMTNAAGVTAVKMLGIRCDAYVHTYSSKLTFGFGPAFFRLSSSSTENVGYLPDWMFNVS